MFFFVLTHLFFNSSRALAATDGGTYYVCSNEDESERQITFTVDLSEKRSERAAVLKIDGIPKEYFEIRRGKIEHLFLVGEKKNLTLQIKKGVRSPLLISLETDPEKSQAQVAHHDDGIVITKFNSSLSIPAEHISNELVHCLETKWTNTSTTRGMISI